MQILCDSPSIQEALDTQAELARLITGYVKRLDEAALNALTAEVLSKVRNAGGLMMAYCHLHGMQHLSTLGTLVQARAEAETARLAQAKLSKQGELNQGLMNDRGMFSFGNLN